MKFPKLSERERKEELQGGERRRRRRIAGQLSRCPRRAQVCVAVSQSQSQCVAVSENVLCFSIGMRLHRVLFECRSL